MNRENEFDARTKRKLADRAGHECSICRARTTGPSAEHAQAVNNVGVAAHIRGARPGSRRFDASMSAAERSNIENGIWLCQVCGKKVDGDEKTWSLPDLYRAKFEAEQRAKERIGRRSREGKGVSVILGPCGYWDHFRAASVYVRVVNEDSRGVDVERVALVVGETVYEATEPIVSFFIGGRELLQRPPIRLAGRGAIEGAWTFSGIEEWPSRERVPSLVLIVKMVGRTAEEYAIQRADDSRGSSRQMPTGDITDDGSIR